VVDRITTAILVEGVNMIICPYLPRKNTLFPLGVLQVCYVYPKDPIPGHFIPGPIGHPSNSSPSPDIFLPTYLV
jgi:hypothetical protein